MLGFFTIVILLSCEEKEAETTLSVSPLELSFTSDGGKKSFEITSNTSWTVTSESENVRPLTTSGSSNQTVEVTVTPSTSVEQKEYRIVVKTADGSKVQNVRIAQEGVFIAEKTTLQVTNYADVVIFGGTENDLDSLRILSNVPWQIKGPEWIEAWNGSRWVALSQSRATVQGDATTGQDAEGTKLLLLRSASSNTSAEDRYDFITITPTYEGNAQVELIAYQLGQYSVQPNITIALSDGLACDWECGVGVKKFAVYLSESRLSDSEIVNTVKDWSVAEPDYIISWSNLKENTVYYLYMVGIDSSGGYHTLNETAFQTGTSKAQALASIENPAYANSRWTWQTKMNEYCKGYYMWVSTNTGFFKSSKVELAWYMAYWTHDEEKLNNDFPMYYQDNSFGLTTEYHILIVTWAAGHDLNHPSYLIDRYCSYDSTTASSRKSSEDMKPICHMNPLDIEGFRKSFVRIKR